MKRQENNHMKSSLFKNINGWSALARRSFALILYAFSFLSIRNKHLWAFGSASSFSGNSKYLLQMVGLAEIRRNSTCQVTKAVTIASEHHDKQLVPAFEMLNVFIPFVFHYISIKDYLRQELNKQS